MRQAGSWALGASFSEQRVFHQLAQNVNNRDVAFLDALRRARGHHDTQHTVRLSQSVRRHCRSAPLASFRCPVAAWKASDDVGGIAGRGDADQYVIRGAHGLHLSGEHVFITEIVSARRQDGRVGRQRDARQARSIPMESADQLAGHVLGRQRQNRRCRRPGPCGAWQTRR